MADVLQDTFDETQRHTKVLFQRAKVLTPPELNEAQDILRVDKALSLFAAAGDGSGDDGLLVACNGASNSITLKAGTYLVQGVHVSFSADVTFASLTTNAGPQDRIDTVYMAVSEAEVPDPNAFASLGETSRRRQLQVQFGAAEGVAIPTSSTTPIYQGGTSYVALCRLRRPAGVAALTQDLATDVRGLLPRKALQSFVQQSASSGVAKPVVTVDSRDQASDAQYGVRDSSGNYLFKVDSQGNVSSGGVTSLYRVNALIPQATDTYDLGSSTLRWRNLYVSGNIYLGDNAFDTQNIQGTVTYTNPNGTSVNIDGTTGFAGFGGLAKSNRQVYVYGSASVQNNFAAGALDADLPPSSDNTLSLGSSAARYKNVYAAQALFNALGANVLQALGGGGAGTAFTLKSSITPDTDGQYNLGASGGAFASLYANSLFANVLGSGSAALVIKSGTNLNPQSTTQSLGSAASPWNYLYANNLTIYSTFSAQTLACATLTAQSGQNIIILDSHMVPTPNNARTLGSTNSGFNAIYVGILAPLQGQNLQCGGHVVPQTGYAVYLGTPGSPWPAVYATNVTANGVVTGSISGPSGSLNTSSLVPAGGANAADVGSQSLPYNSIYATTGHQTIVGPFTFNEQATKAANVGYAFLSGVTGYWMPGQAGSIIRVSGSIQMAGSRSYTTANSYTISIYDTANTPSGAGGTSTLINSFTSTMVAGVGKINYFNFVANRGVNNFSSNQTSTTGHTILVGLTFNTTTDGGTGDLFLTVVQ